MSLMVSNLDHLISQTKVEHLKTKLPKVVGAVNDRPDRAVRISMMDLLKTDYVTLSHFIWVINKPNMIIRDNLHTIICAILISRYLSMSSSQSGYGVIFRRHCDVILSNYDVIMFFMSLLGIFL